MKCMVVYSSKTGNTKMIAEAIINVLPAGSEIYSAEQAPLPDDYDFIAVGGWVDKGMPDEGAKKYMQMIRGKNVGIFMTLGAYPDSEHAKESMKKAKDLMTGNNILVTFICQGKVDPELIKWMQDISKNNPAHPHAMDEKRRIRLAEATKHPDQQDCQNAASAFANIVETIQGVANA